MGKRNHMVEPRNSDCRALPFERVMTVSGFGIWIVLLPVLFFLYGTLGPSPDHSIFDYIAWLSHQGRPAYLDAFEVNWPGAVLLHIVSQAIFGPNDLAFRYFDFIVMQVTVIVAAAMLWRGGLRVGAAWLLALYPPLYITSGLWMAGQRDIVAVEFLIIACLFLSNAERRTWGLIMAGALCMFAVAIRPTYLAFLAGAVLLEFIWPKKGAISLRDRVWPAVAILLGAGLMLLGLVGLGLITGSLGAWYQAAVEYALNCYGRLAAPQPLTGTLFSLLVKSWHWLVLLAAVGSVLWVLRKDLDRRALLLCLGVLANCFLSFVFQNKGFGYHLGGLLLIFSIMAAVALDGVSRMAFGPSVITSDAIDKLVPQVAWKVGLVGVLALCILGVSSKLNGSIRSVSSGGLSWTMQPPTSDTACESASAAIRAAEYIASATSSAAYVLPVNCGYRAAFLAQRLPSSKFGTSPSFAAPNIQCAIGDELLDQYMLDVQRNEPEIIIASAHHFDAGSATMMPIPGGSASAERVAKWAKDYRRVARFGDVLLFARPAFKSLS